MFSRFLLCGYWFVFEIISCSPFSKTAPKRKLRLTNDPELVAANKLKRLSAKSRSNQSGIRRITMTTHFLWANLWDRFGEKKKRSGASVPCVPSVTSSPLPTSSIRLCTHALWKQVDPNGWLVTPVSKLVPFYSPTLPKWWLQFKKKIKNFEGNHYNKNGKNVILPFFHFVRLKVAMIKQKKILK